MSSDEGVTLQNYILAFSFTLLLFSVLNITSFNLILAIIATLLIYLITGYTVLTALHILPLVLIELNYYQIISKATFDLVLLASSLVPILYAESRDIIDTKTIITSLLKYPKPNLAIPFMAAGVHYLLSSLLVYAITVVGEHAIYASETLVLPAIISVPYIIGLLISYNAKLFHRDYLPLFPALALAPFTLAPLITLIRMLDIDNKMQLSTLYYSRRGNCISIGTIIAVLAYNPRDKMDLVTGVREESIEWGWLRTQERKYCIPLEVKAPTHVLIIGASGAGKSYTVATIVKNATNCLQQQVPIIVIDPHGEYGRLLGKDYEVINALEYMPDIMDPFNEPIELHIERIIEYYRTMVNLGPLQEQLLREALIDLYTQYNSSQTSSKPSLEELERILSTIANHEPRAEQLVNYTRLLRSLLRGKRTLTTETIAEKKVIIDLSSLPTEWAKRIYVDTLLRLLYTYLTRKGITDNPRLLLVVDEAHLFAPPTRQQRMQSMLVKGALEMRKYGVVIIIATQNPTKIDRAIIANTSYKLVLPLFDPLEVDQAVKILTLSESNSKNNIVAATIPHLSRGLIVAKDREIPQPLIIRLEQCSNYFQHKL